MSDAANWCLIESDPGVFTELVQDFGVTGVQVEEIYSLDADTFAQLKPVHGLIFLFKWLPSDELSGRLDVENTNNVFFAQQVITNACATQALINLLLNVEDDDVDLGKTLKEYKDFASALDPANRGLCLGNLDAIRNAHNSFARQQLFELENRTGQKEDAFHFVTYLPVRGHIYELDGLREAPIDLGEIKEGQDWLDAVRPIIQNRINNYTAGEIHFNLMAVIADRKNAYEKRLNDLLEDGMETDQKTTELVELQSLIQEEEDKRIRYRRENIRRRHNYVPFIVELLRVLAKEQKLVPLVEEAINLAEKRTAAALAAGASKSSS